MDLDPGRLPYRQLQREARLAEDAREAKAELYAQVEADRKAGISPPRGLRRVLRRVRNRMSRQR